MRRVFHNGVMRWAATPGKVETRYAVRRWAGARRYNEDQERGPDGRFGSGDGGGDTHQQITAEEARGNSRPVSAAEFQSLASSGKDQLAALEGNTRPASAITDAAKFDSVKASAFESVQKQWGGQTIDPATGKTVEPKSGYALTVRNPGQAQISVPIGASKDAFNSAMDKAATQYADKLQGAQIHLGVFRDDDTGRIDVDPVAIVQTPAEVEAIGAYTHATGGAYDFATGDGYFPPHVGGESD